MLGDRGGQLTERLLIKLLPGLIPVGLDLQKTQGDGFPLLLHGVFGKQGFQPLAVRSFWPPLF